MSSSSNTAGGGPYSRNSTPATDISPPGSPDFVLPPPSAETLRRRAQSDRASSEIGNRMLKGWAMLSEECPNDDCWAIPLVRHPRARPGAEPDPRKECVICGTVYISDESGQLVAQRPAATQSNATPQPNPLRLANRAAPPTAQAPPKGPSTSAAPRDTQPVPKVAGSSTSNRTPIAHLSPAGPHASPFASAEGSLGEALEVLSQRLVQVSLASDLNTRQVKETAEAMETVMRALNTAKQLRLGN